MPKPHLGTLRKGPNPNWLPGRSHENQIHAMATWLILNLGLEQDEAKAAAFKLWREGQKASYR